MTVKAEEIQGIIAQIVWTGTKCPAKRRLRVTMGEPKSVTCTECGHVDTVILGEGHGGEVT